MLSLPLNSWENEDTFAMNNISGRNASITMFGYKIWEDPTCLLGSVSRKARCGPSLEIETFGFLVLKKLPSQLENLLLPLFLNDFTLASSPFTCLLPITNESFFKVDDIGQKYLKSSSNAESTHILLSLPIN